MKRALAWLIHKVLYVLGWGIFLFALGFAVSAGWKLFKMGFDLATGFLA